MGDEAEPRVAQMKCRAIRDKMPRCEAPGQASEYPDEQFPDFAQVALRHTPPDQQKPKRFLGFTQVSWGSRQKHSIFGRVRAFGQVGAVRQIDSAGSIRSTCVRIDDVCPGNFHGRCLRGGRKVGRRRKLVVRFICAVLRDHRRGRRLPPKLDRLVPIP